VTRGETAAATIAVGGLAAVAAWSLVTGGAGPRLAARLELTADSPGCPRHGLYRRFDGHAARHALTQPGGWSWFASPPAAEVL
jgi:hypothetical protein